MRTIGELFLIGGAEAHHDECDILRQLVTSSGGQNARVGLLTLATGSPGVSLQRYRAVFERLGVLEFRPLYPLRSPDPTRCLHRLTVLFLSGGDQERLVRRVRGREWWTQVMRRYLLHGLNLAGTSAGASAMGCHMIARDDEGIPVVQPGLGVLSGVLIDQHFSERSRLERLKRACSEMPDHIGIGLDENTALWRSSAGWRILGTGRVTVCKRGTNTVISRSESTADTLERLIGSESMDHGSFLWNRSRHRARIVEKTL